MIKKKVFTDSISFKAFSRDVSKIKTMTTKRENEIKALMLDPNTDEATKTRLKAELVEGHFKFVLQQANKFNGLGIELEDLIAEGNMGLMIAVNSFDWARGIKFITHANQWVRHEILNAIYNYGRTIRLPINIAQQLHREVKALNEENKEISDDMANLPNTTDLYKSVSEDTMLVDLVKNHNAEYADSQAELNSTIEYIMSKLDKKQQKVIRLLFGIDGRELDIKEVAEEMGMHKESIRQIKIKAIELLSSYGLKGV